MKYIGLERVRDVMREALGEKSLGERAMTREVNIMWQDGMIGAAARCGFVLVWCGEGLDDVVFWKEEMSGREGEERERGERIAGAGGVGQAVGELLYGNCSEENNQWFS